LSIFFFKLIMIVYLDKGIDSIFSCGYICIYSYTFYLGLSYYLYEYFEDYIVFIL